MRASRDNTDVNHIPVDFLADPDGCWDYEALAVSAGFGVDAIDNLLVGALTEPYAGFPEGTAVVVLAGEAGSSVALVDCTVVDRRIGHLHASAA